MAYRMINGREEMNTDEVVRLLQGTYWANHRSKEQIETSMRNSACYGILDEESGRLTGFARVITDYATTWYLCDVVIDPEYRHQGLGKALVSHVVSRPEFAGLRGFLMTRDAHGLYAKYGFVPVNGRAMEKAP